MPRYRQVSFAFGPPLTPVIRRLIVIISVIFALTYLPARVVGWSLPFRWFSLVPYEVTHRFFLWQLVTYMFLHGGFFHIIFNLLAMWMFGSDLERQWGPRRFLFYFFLTGIGAGVCDVLVHPSSATFTIGSSGAVYGLLLAFGVLYPDRPILYAFIFPMKAKWLVILTGMIEFFLSLDTPGSGVSHIAHLGGMLFGYIYLRGGGLPYRLQLRFHEWRRARLRKRFEVYMRKQEKKSGPGHWVN